MVFSERAFLKELIFVGILLNLAIVPFSLKIVPVDIRFIPHFRINRTSNINCKIDQTNTH